MRITTGTAKHLGMAGAAAITVVGVMLCSAQARAEQPPSVEADGKDTTEHDQALADDHPALRVAVGLTTAGQQTSYGGVGNYTGPAYSLMLEPTIVPWLRLLARGTAGIRGYESDVGSGSWREVSGSVGPRFVVNPGDRLELSLFVLVGGRYHANDANYEESAGLASTGVGLELEIIRPIALRFDTDLAHAAIERTQHDVHPTQHRSSVSALIVPTFALVFRI